MMDVSAVYIKMCTKATEVQEEWKKWCKDIRDEEYPYFFNNWDGSFFYEDYDIEAEEDEKIVMKDPAEYYIEEFDKETLKKVFWLPRLDQILEMMKGGLHELLEKFALFMDPWDQVSSMPYKSEVEYVEKEVEYIESFESMEQLWLAFVMREKYGKSWSGEEWE